MTPKEKAQELVNKYLPIVNGAIWVKPKIKECALITVNEIILSLSYIENTPFCEAIENFYKEVKKEIEAI